MKKIIAIGVVAIVAVSAGGYWLFFKDRPSPSGKIFVSGNIEAIEVDLSFRIGGQIATRPVDEGDRVKKDQVVATLDTDTLVTQKGSAEAERANARAVLDQLEEGTRKEQIESARALFKAAESKLKNARDEYERHQLLFQEKAISGSMFDSKETAFKVALEEYNNASERLRELEAGPREQEIRARLERVSARPIGI